MLLLLHLYVVLAVVLGRWSLVEPRSFCFHGRSSHAVSELEAFVVSYRDSRDKGGKVVYQLLILGLGVTLPYMEAGITMELGERVVVRVRWNNGNEIYTIACSHHGLVNPVLEALC